MCDVCNIDIILTDREKILITSNNLKEYVNKSLDEKLKLLIDNRESYVSNIKENKFNLMKYFTIFPIITSTDCSGLIIIVSENKQDENIIYAKIVQKLISQKLDVA